MSLDLLAAILLAIAIFKGYRKGLILAIFSFFAILIGLAAAVKFSVVVAGFLQKNQLHGKWITFLSFLIVLISVIIIVKLIARVIEKTMTFIFIGWLNKLGGILLYVLLYMMVYSVLLFYGAKIGLVGKDAIDKSVSYPVIKPLGPYFIEHLGYIIPWFKNMFSDISRIFGEIAGNVSR